MGQIGDFGDGLNGAHLVIGMHDGNQNGLWSNGSGHIIGINQSVTIDLQIGHFKTFIFQKTTHLNYRGMFNGRGNDVVALIPISISHTFNRIIVGLGPAAGENDFIDTAAEHVSYLSSGRFHGFFGGNAVPMTTGRIAKMFIQIRQHGLSHPRINGRRSVII